MRCLNLQFFLSVLWLSRMTVSGGKAFDWCDYSGVIGNRRVGVTVMPDPTNFRPSWFHNRDYGWMVANPFGRKSMNQGEASRVEVKRLPLRWARLLRTPCRNRLWPWPGRAGPTSCSVPSPAVLISRGRAIPRSPISSPQLQHHDRGQGIHHRLIQQFNPEEGQ